MLHPVGSLTPSVYWRRRLVVLVPILLVILTVYVGCSVSSHKKSATPPPPVGSSSHSAVSPPSTAHSSSPASPTSAKTTTSAPPKTPPSTAAQTSTSVPRACAKTALKIAAATGAANYPVGAQPMLYLQVTNVGTVPCVEDLSDPQIVLTVFNGASRVWGSHDCQIAPGASPQTLVVNAPVRRSITWTGLSSEPQQCTNRQRVGAGTYTLQASLAGTVGTTAKFTIS